jgi:hypothetical protein
MMEIITGDISVLHKIFTKSKDDIIRIWSMPGWRGCPMVKHEGGATSYPLGFNYSGVPEKLLPWMRGLDEGGS